MPRGPTVTAVGMWVADGSRDSCKECRSSFGTFTRKHHCRRCGDIFCHKCSNYWSRDIPELPDYKDQEALRVCRSCYMHQLCHMVVHRGRFSLKYELFGSLSEAQEYYNKLKTGKLLMYVRANTVLQTEADTERIRESLMNRAQGARNMLLGGHDIAPLLQAPATAVGVSTRLSLVLDANNGKIPIGTHHLVFCVQLIASGEWSHTVIECSTGPGRAALIARFEEQFKCSNQIKKAIVYPARDHATPLSVKGNGVLNMTLASTIVNESRKHLNSTPYMVVYHIAGKCQSMKCSNLIDGFNQLEKMPGDCPCMLIAPSFDVIAKRRCEIASFEETMLTFAGEQILTILKISQVAVVSARGAPSITSNMHTARHAAKAILSSAGPVYVAIIGLPMPAAASANTSPMVPRTPQLSAPASTASSAPLTASRPVMLWNTNTQDAASWFVQPSVALPAEVVNTAVELLQDAVRRAAEPSPRDVSPRLDGMNLADARALICECCICMDMYDVQNRRPVFCPSCGNTICLACWTQTPKCPSCRCDRAARPTFCIPLIQLLSNDERA